MIKVWVLIKAQKCTSNIKKLLMIELFYLADV